MCQPPKTLGQKSNLPGLVLRQIPPLYSSGAPASPLLTTHPVPLYFLLHRVPVVCCIKDFCDLIFITLLSAPYLPCVLWFCEFQFSLKHRLLSVLWSGLVWLLLLLFTCCSLYLRNPPRPPLLFLLIIQTFCHTLLLSETHPDSQLWERRLS